MIAAALARVGAAGGGALLTTGLAAVLALAVLASAGLGAVPIPAGRVLLALVGAGPDPQEIAVVRELRLPRILTATLVGAVLGLAGAVLQGLFRNPLADAALVGVSGGAALAAVATIILAGTLAAVLPAGAGPWLLPAGAYLGALAAVSAVLALGRRSQGTALLLLAGIGVNAVASALMGLLIHMADDRQLRDIVFWSFGSVAGAGWSGVAVLAGPAVLSTLALLRLARPLDALLLGDREAGHLGLDVGRTKTAAVLAVALGVGAAVAFTGMIGFVGVVVPHAVRLVAGPGHRRLLPASALGGAALLVIADTLARLLVAPAELPVGLVTAMIGAPVFLWLLARGGRGA